MTRYFVPVLTPAEQIEWCYGEHTPGQQQWLRWAKRMRAQGRQGEVPGPIPTRPYRRAAA